MWAVKHKSGTVLFVTNCERTANNRREMGWIVEEVKMTSRERFEDWYLKNIGYPLGYDQGIEYNLWYAWQSSREEIVVDLSKMHLLLCDQNDVVSELTKHGLKVKV